MDTPPIGVPLVFIHTLTGRPWFTTFRLHRDGSWGFDFPHPGPGEWAGLVFRASGRSDPDGRGGLARLGALGFVPLDEAVRLGWVPAGWHPPDPLTESGPV